MTDIHDWVKTPRRVRWAFNLAEMQHSGDFYGTEPYINHPVRVFEMVRSAGLSESHQIVALLHDVVEDTDATIDDIYSRFGSLIATSVDAITKRPGEPHELYFARVMADDVAHTVKLFDSTSNLLSSLLIRDQERIDRYLGYIAELS